LIHFYKRDYKVLAGRLRLGAHMRFGEVLPAGLFLPSPREDEQK
jgi:hypothetical protein